MYSLSANRGGLQVEESEYNNSGEFPPPTIPESLCINLQGFSEESDARKFGNLLAAKIQAISRFIDLERIDGVTVAFDYDQALINLDRGFSPSRPLTRSSNTHTLGVAMAAPVLREGVVKGHLLFYAPCIIQLELGSGEEYYEALYTVAHECGHIEDLKFRDECFPKTILQKKVTDQKAALLHQTADLLWEEYAACITSAIFRPEQSDIYEEAFILALTNAREIANGAIREYRIHSDTELVLNEAGNALCEPLRMMAYLLGHLDGIGKNLESLPNVRALLENSEYSPFIDRLSLCLRKMRSEKKLWKSMRVYSPLCKIVDDIYCHGGLVLNELPDGNIYVDVPFTDATR